MKLWLIALCSLALVFTACIETSNVGDITPEELRDVPPFGATILDVRTPAEYEAGHVPGAINIPHDQLSSRLGELGADPQAPLIVYCEMGGRAGVAIDLLQSEGYLDLRHLDGDMKAWRAMMASGAAE